MRVLRFKRVVERYEARWGVRSLGKQDWTVDNVCYCQLLPLV